jgi:hypothetical protein
MEFWQRGADVAFFDRQLMPEVTMVCARVGLLSGAEVVAAVGEDDVSWTAVRMSAHATSVYQRSDDEWLLAIHQQTPAG